MRLSIERLRTLVLIAGALLIVALLSFLAVGRWKSRFTARELPKRLGVDIQQEANGVTYTQSRHGHTLFKIHASKVVQLKKDGRALLHDVQIELYGPDGSRADRITGGEFEYDQKAGTAEAAGPVEIIITRPSTPLGKASPALQNAARTVESGQIDVKTSGLTFDQKTGVAITQQQVQFSTVQGSGSAIGATFDSDGGKLVLDHAVQLAVQRGSEPVQLRAGHAEFERGTLVCSLKQAEASYSKGTATAGEATVLFREDGSAVRLDARGGFALSSNTGSHVTAPAGSLEFNEHNQPTHGRMQGGVGLESERPSGFVRGTSPTADITFTADGDLRHVHLERGVNLQSDQRADNGLRSERIWRSPVADIDFRKTAQGHVEIASVHGTGGVEVSGQTQTEKGLTPLRLAADTLDASFARGQELQAVKGMGHASLEQTTALGVRQTTSGDRIDVHLAPPSGEEHTSAARVQSAAVDGNVVLTQAPQRKPGGGEEPGMRATAGHAAYDAAGAWLHLTTNPRVDDGELQLTADRLDVSQATGDGVAHGNVKATWQRPAAPTSHSQSGASASTGPVGFGGQAPAHVIADEAQLQKSTGEATFSGHARLWQQTNSIEAPLITLNRQRQTLVAHAGGAGQPVRLVLLSGAREGSTHAGVVRARAGELKYSEAERKAFLTGNVTAETGTATTSADQAEIVLLPPGNHAGPEGGSAQVDRLTARGNVQVTSMGRRGTGTQLVYSSESGEYVLTGTGSQPPRITDPVRGTVTGQSLIFNGRDDSVSIEGSGHKTTTETVAPR